MVVLLRPPWPRAQPRRRVCSGPHATPLLSTRWPQTPASASGACLSPPPAPKRSPEAEAQARFSLRSAQEAAECVRWWRPLASLMEGLAHPTPQCDPFLPPRPLPGWVRTACPPLRLYSVGVGTAWVYRRCVCTKGLNKDVGFCDSRVVVLLPFSGALSPSHSSTCHQGVWGVLLAHAFN